MMSTQYNGLLTMEFCQGHACRLRNAMLHGFNDVRVCATMQSPACLIHTDA